MLCIGQNTVYGFQYPLGLLELGPRRQEGTTIFSSSFYERYLYGCIPKDPNCICRLKDSLSPTLSALWLLDKPFLKNGYASNIKGQG